MKDLRELLAEAFKAAEDIVELARSPRGKQLLHQYTTGEMPRSTGFDWYPQPTTPPISLTFSDQAFALLGSDLPASTYSLTSDQELEQWAIRETLPAI